MKKRIPLHCSFDTIINLLSSPKDDQKGMWEKNVIYVAMITEKNSEIATAFSNSERIINKKIMLLHS